MAFIYRNESLGPVLTICIYEILYKRLFLRGFYFCYFRKDDKFVKIKTSENTFILNVVILT